MLSDLDISAGPVRFCKGCNGQYRSHNPKALTCGKPMCRQYIRTAGRRNHEIEFIGVDGEGVGRGSQHKYVLLGVGSVQHENPNGILWEEALSFLYSCYAESPKAAYVGFFLSYDWCQIFRSLPENRARMLWTSEGIGARKRTRSGGNPIPFPVYLKGEKYEWEIDSLGMRRIKFRPRLISGRAAWMYICDSGPFFQTSFLNVINPATWESPVVSNSEYRLIKRGKESRETAILGPDMRKYNSLENDCLARVMTQLNKGFTAAGIRLRKTQWFGPGQAAQAWMANNDVPTSTDICKSIPAYALAAATATYFGGWFELFAHGYIGGRIWEYDINSAYPAIIAKLPCLLHGHWCKTPRGKRGGPVRLSGKALRPGTYSMVHGTIHGSNGHIGSGLHRDSDGNIRRPHNTGGWYWLHELQAAKRAGLIDRWYLDEVITYEPCGCPPPIRGIAGLYDGRIRVGKNSPEGKGYKLVYNSEYGKFAQSVGLPLFANPLYASLITAGCRTQILDAIATHPGGASQVAMVATDGVYFLSPHPGLSLSNKLGEWECATHENMTLFKPGVYWDEDARRAIRDDKAPQFKARGVNARAFSKCLTAIDREFVAWGQAHPAILPDEPDCPNWPKVRFPISFAMTTMTQALQYGKWFLAGHVATDKELEQDSNPCLKRYVGTMWKDERAWRTRPYKTGNFGEQRLESYPYEKDFGMTYEETPDGDIVEVIARAIGTAKLWEATQARPPARWWLRHGCTWLSQALHALSVTPAPRFTVGTSPCTTGATVGPPPGSTVATLP